VTREFLERLALPELLDQEASAVSLARGAEPDLRVCRDLADFLEPLDLTDLREPLGQLAPPEPRDPPACRECPEREELAVSPAPRETEVTTERKDLRELPARTVLEV